jgi:bifunctional DNA-binding transcriptional regulator/antitoxin component of YhaV-PrlF toxin-antitoxin module
MPLSSRLTSKCQVTVPREIRRALRLSPGNLVHFAIEGGKAFLSPAPESHTQALKGLGKDAWGALGGADRFLRRERDSWA